MTGGFPLSTNHIKLKFMEVNLWHFSIAQLLLCRPSLWASAVPCVFGAVSTFWKVTARITLPASRRASSSLWLSRCNQEKKGKAQSRRNRRCSQEILWKRKISAIMGIKHLTMERKAGSLCTLVISHYGTH